jgi:peptidyl-tRNA hydrolase, PTH1 family
MSLVGLGGIAGKRVAVAKPQTFMNLSGPAVKGLLERYELKPDRLIVVYDELDLPWGSLRIRIKGSAAGHNGVKGWIGSLGTNEFTRIRLGIDTGSPAKGAQVVLGQFKRAQKQDVEETVVRAADAVEFILAEGAAQAMTKYNRRAQGLKTEEE